MPTSLPHIVEECRGVLFVYSDSTVVRSENPSFPVPVHDDGSVEWKDVQFDPINNLSLRLYKPRHVTSKLPIFFYFHGGGFCIGSRTWPNCQNYCFRLASELPAIVIAPDYRLAPEHRLPGAIDDSIACLLWLQKQAAGFNSDPWLLDYADFKRVVVSGDSAGGTIAHHLAVRFGSTSGRTELEPVQIKGYVQLMPFFGGVERTRSEAQCPKEAFLNLELNDRYWRLSLPIGANFDHPSANPFGPDSPPLEPVEFAPTLVVVGECDLLTDRSVDYANRLKQMGKPVEVAEFKGQQHGFFTINPWSESSAELMRMLRRFVEEVGVRSS
ncbi:alpha/beta-Hydrolases superfamily protein [Rhynchospora pubera]|uniref:Alpha/beta-Hydrolases superfamily protein n=1 Tax=Rhynchospora pubera TaxID=906938 RepID=A0AAV8BRL8_9POAL|nr:alpha/beta-Hydrolases superfamily protein [Rhynchospora pubera]KAJ4745758.1 alpha/beta-Hydrolases superfamily protein [Rhynchospora pubera]